MIDNSISQAVLSRLPTYLGYIRSIAEEGAENVSAASIARALGFGEVSVRKDLAAICDLGRPKVGYSVQELLLTIESFLGYDRTDNAVIAGAGKLGRALLDYDGFAEYGLNILAAFDCEVSGNSQGSKKPILHISELKTFCTEHGIKIGIIAVPADAAWEVYRLMADAGIKAVMNFAPVHLTSDDGIQVRNENLATSLALLAKSI